MRNSQNSTTSSNGGVARPRSLINTAQGQNQRTHVSFYSYTIPDDPPTNQNGRNTGDSFERNGNNRNQQSGDVLQIDNWEALDSLPQILGLVFKNAIIGGTILVAYTVYDTVYDIPCSCYGYHENQEKK